MTIEVEAISVDEADFDFDATTEEGTASTVGTVVEDADVKNPVNVAASAQSIATSAGSGVTILVSWNAPANDSYVHQIQYRIKDVGGGTPGGWFIVDVPNAQDQQYTPALTDGDIYEIQARARSRDGRSSDWTPATEISVIATADTNAPASVSGVTATGGGGNVDFGWTAPNSANYSATRIYRHDADDFAVSSLVHTEYGAANSIDSHQDTGLAADNYWYWLVAINGSGVEASEVATGSVTVI